MPSFAHLHTHSYYSLLNALPSPLKLVERIKEQGGGAVALTDDDALYGAIPFYQAAKAAGIKPIIGLDVHIAPNGCHNKRARIDKQAWRLVLLAKDNVGYGNLLKLSSAGFLEGFYYTARVDDELLAQYHEGLIALSGGLGGEIPTLLKNGDRAKAAERVRFYQDLFGANHFYIELVHRADDPDQVRINRLLIELSQETGVPLVATSNAFYLDPNDHEGWEAMRCIQKGQTLEEYRRMSGADVDLSLASPEAMEKEFASVPEALANTQAIAERCNVTIELGVNHLPIFQVPGGQIDGSYLRELCEAGLVKRYGTVTPEMRERFEFEFATVTKMGFASYFLVVADFVNEAKRRGVLVGPGRGSAAGSIISYVLGITDIDPLAYGLLFERFLNPDRVSMPDIDMDFADSRRGEVLEYVRDKYGSDHVAGIVTFGKMMPKAAVRDAARVLGLSFKEADAIAKLVPLPVQGRHTPLKKAIEEHVELRNAYQSHPQTKQVIDLAMAIEGAPRHTSQHACGVVISNKPLTEYVPIQSSQHEDLDYVSQYSLEPIEATGLVKMDFLGLSNLTIIEQALEIIKAVHGVKIDIDAVPLTDAKTFELLSRGETVGVFQLESDGMQRYLAELKPTVFEDIMAMCALYRPGPLSAGMVPAYINRKNGREKVVYDHPKMEEVLKETYGVTVYQEQIMRICRALAGFTGGEADTLRKAMGKKKRDVLDKMKEHFVDGCKQNGVAEKIAKKIWTDWEGFADYAFNKSHTACYGLIAYRTAYLKAHYPAEFMAAVMNSDAGNIDRITVEVQECLRVGLQVRPPDVNESFQGFGVVGKEKKIRWGLVAIKNVGEEIANVIVRERKANGPYKDVGDFALRIQSKHLNRKSLESLVMAGALDRFAQRGTLLANVEQILRFSREAQAQAANKQARLFDLASGFDMQQLRLTAVPDASRSEKLSWERELLGIYVSEHPFRAYADRLAPLLITISAVGSMEDKKPVRVAGVILAARAVVTKKGEAMAFLTLEDHTGSVEVVVFPRVFAEHRSYLVEGQLIVGTGRTSAREGQPMSVVLDSVACLSEANVGEIETMLRGGMWVGEDVHRAAVERRTPLTPVRSVVIDLSTAPSDKQIRGLRELFQKKPGDVPVQFAVDAGGGRKLIRTEYSIAPTQAVMDAIRDMAVGAVSLVEPEKIG